MAEKSVNFTLRMTPEQRFALDRIACEQGRTTTNLINFWLKQNIDAWHENKKNAKK